MRVFQVSFWPEWPDSSQCRLDLSALKLQDSAVYLCASSGDTALAESISLCTNLQGPGRKPRGHPGLDWHFPSDHSPACGVTWHGSGEFPLHRHQQCMPGSSKEKDCEMRKTFSSEKDCAKPFKFKQFLNLLFAGGQHEELSPCKGHEEGGLAGAKA